MANYSFEMKDEVQAKEKITIWIAPTFWSHIYSHSEDNKQQRLRGYVFLHNV